MDFTTDSNTNVLSDSELALEIKALLSSSPPFLDPTPTSIQILTQLLETNSSNESLWLSLDSLPPCSSDPVNLLEFLTTSINSPIQPIPKEIKELYQQLLIASSNTQISEGAGEGGGELNCFTATTTGSNNKVEIYDDGSLCLSCCINPTLASDVVLTPHKIVLTPVNFEPSSSTLEVGNQSWWDFGWSSGSKGKGNSSMVARKIWLPQPDKISVKVMWYGYEIFIPHSVMVKVDKSIDPYLNTLDSIATALNFLVNHIPASLAALPPVLLFKTLVPIISTIAGFIVWYWKRVESEDRPTPDGNVLGVVLTATWLLPVALFPRSWTKPASVEVVQLVEPVEVQNEGIQDEEIQDDGNQDEVLSRELSLAMTINEEVELNDTSTVEESIAALPVLKVSIKPSETFPSTPPAKGIEPSRFFEELPPQSSPSLSFLPPSTPTTPTTTHADSSRSVDLVDSESVAVEEGEVDSISSETGMSGDLHRAEKLSGLFSFVKRGKKD